jgi:hypothetical protein
MEVADLALTMRLFQPQSLNCFITGPLMDRTGALARLLAIFHFGSTLFPVLRVAGTC